MAKKTSDLQQLKNLITSSGLSITKSEATLIAKNILSRTKGDRSLRSLQKQLVELDKKLIKIVEKQERQRKIIAELHEMLEHHKATIEGQLSILKKVKKRR